ncbi:Fungal specific transcription factor domain-containing protein [Cladophialophora immunda]|nr:Fungal specific transcription factor domain-containing protein [Cladophialophora immunda]
MCAGSAALEGEYFSNYGYSSKAAARREYYTKSKLLLDLDVESDRMIACQASLLLMSWSSREDSKDPMYWVGSAINHAFAMRLQEEHTKMAERRRSADQRLKRRIWWTIVVRECDVAMNLARPPRLRPRDDHLLDHDDFSNEVDLSNINFGALIGIKMFLADSSLQRHLERACMERAKLAVQVYSILHRTAEEAFKSHSDFAKRNNRISELEDSLRNWSTHLPEELQLENICSVSFDLCHRAYYLASCMVHLTYWMAVIVLHSSEISERQWATCSHTSENHHHEDNGNSGDCHVHALRQASNKITTIYSGLNSRRLTQFVPVTGIASVCSAAFVYLLDASTGHLSSGKSSLESLAICIEAVRQIGRINFTANAVFKRVEAAYSAAQKASFPSWLKTKQPGPEFVTSTIDNNDAVTGDGPPLSLSNQCSGTTQEQHGGHASLFASTQDFFTLFESNVLFEDSLLHFDFEDQTMQEAIPAAESEDGNLDTMTWSMGLAMGPEGDNEES